MKKSITVGVCSSASFYEEVVKIKKQLLELGFQVIVPKVADLMAKSGNYDIYQYKTWFANPDDYHKKAALIREHFAELEKCDITLVVNNTKNNTANYIGGNVLMEMAVAFYLNKPIYLLNDVPKDSPLLEEILGLGSVPLKGDLSLLTKKYL